MGGIHERLVAAVGGIEHFRGNWSWRSHSPEKRARDALADATVMIEQGQAMIVALGGCPEQVEQWTAKAIKLWLSYQAAGARTANPMVTGPANFPVARNQKALAVEQRRGDEWFTHATGARAWINYQKRRAAKAALSAEAASVAHRTIEFDGVKLVQNTTLDRIQLVFDGKPDPETIALLKEAAFRWSPREGAWQRKNTNNGVQSAYRILRALGHGGAA